MIKLTHVEPSGPHSLSLAFSDGSHGEWFGEDLLKAKTVLTEPLADKSYFARAFISFGALAWPNGLELSAGSLHEELASSGKLNSAAAA